MADVELCCAAAERGFAAEGDGVEAHAQAKAAFAVLLGGYGGLADSGAERERGRVELRDAGGIVVDCRGVVGGGAECVATGGGARILIRDADSECE